MRLHTLKELDSSEGTVKLHTEGDDGAFVLHPTPNPNDPNDPLRWPRWKKHVCFGSVCAFTFLGNFAIGMLIFRVIVHQRVSADNPRRRSRSSILHPELGV
jgi:hypothetical protein